MPRAKVKIRHARGFGWRRGWWVDCSVCGPCLYAIDTKYQARATRRGHKCAHRRGWGPIEGDGRP